MGVSDQLHDPVELSPYRGKITWKAGGNQIRSEGFEQGNSILHIIVIISNLSNDRFKASSKTIPPHSAI